jgi:hypothetical protein
LGGFYFLFSSRIFGRYIFILVRILCFIKSAAVEIKGLRLCTQKHRIPFYTEAKLIIVLWLILPQTQGASVFYTNYLDPFLHQHEQHIDNALLEIQAKLKETILLYGKQLMDSIKKLVADTIGFKVCLFAYMLVYHGVNS